jgi:PhzF family phenazine biosynthesis protein
MELPLYQLDAFATRRFAGNPAAVCPLDSWIGDDLMQAIANENNLAETAFLVREGDGYRIRWFTPTHEVELCGHATLAAGYVVATRLQPGATEIAFASKSGLLKVRRDGDLYVLDFPANPPRPASPPEGLAAALGATPAETLGAGIWCLAVFRNAGEVAALKPDMALLGALPADAVIATAPGEGCDFASRCFVPKLGIPEDPVTGSAHCVLTPYWAARLGKTALEARQISARGGELVCGLPGGPAGERVTIAGQVVPYLEGRIHV